MPHFRVTVLPCGRREIVEVVERRPPDHPVLGTLAIDGDAVAWYLLKRCAFGPDAVVSARELFQGFQKWARAEGIDAMSQTSFGRRLTVLGFVARKSGPRGTIMRRGLRLLG